MQRFARPVVAAIACGIAAAIAAPVLAETFGNVRYTTPKDWKASVTEKSIFLSPPNEKSLMAIVLLPGSKTSDSAEDGAKKIWQFFTKTLEMEGEIKSQKSYKTDAGIRFVTGMGQMKKTDNEDESLVAMVNVFEVNGNLEYVVVLARDTDTLKKYSGEVVKFLNAVEFGAGAGGGETKKPEATKKDTVDAFIQGLD